ncbi:MULTISPECIES: DUF397 domain-containing protein [Streptomyces]|uniref:DUF397 domain-containing protein n=1 Tax=Streptomyces sviceus (strain ATCC 29083 / DSM 924 / JCM 4929 / NBRC 13980 / NCIMB 11184 / NRRL 5439 / UC 5370) TaxID=463191 RepID=B5HVT4_STRX2|nr:MULTISPECIES: DUF397 domain-containing protein [Streptomyces]EDY56940.1 conserved hypothetical protein [Streptomyces sviceus ATCC 29083]
MNWRKSTYSGGGEGNTCVEIAPLPTRIAVRDSKAPARATLSFPTPAFTALIDHLKEHPWSEGRLPG